jgi:hypothetical protein
MPRRLVPAVLALSFGVSAALHAQGPAIDHKPVGCIVAGNFPKLNACFSPASTVARARVYFKGTAPTAGPHWYWVEFKSDSPCFVAILPKPMKNMTGMSYYVEVADKQFREARNADQAVKVVPDAGGCDKDVPVAGWVQNASVVVGGPAGASTIPLGFSGAGVVGVGGGIGTGVVVGGVVAAGAAGAGVYTLTSDDSTDDPGPPPPPPPAATATPTPAPPVPPAPTATPVPPGPTPTSAPFRANCRVFPTFGREPLVVSFDCCASTGTNLRFEYDFDGDKVEDARNVCRTSRTYTLKGTSFAPLLTTTPTIERDFFASITVREALSDGGRTVETFRITVEGDATLRIQSVKPSEASRRVSWTAELSGASSAQLVVNGSSATYARTGKSSGNAVGRAGINRMEMQLVQGGEAGRVTFDLRSMPSFVPGSLRMVAGDVVAVTDTAITFRLKGQAGERVVFTLTAAD